MKLRACECGKEPVLHIAKRGTVYTTQVACECGEHTATIMHTRPTDHAWAQQVAVDAWNLKPW